MKTTKLIAFTGLAQAGKTTAADLFCRVGFEKFSFATPLKQMLRVLTDAVDKDSRPPELCGKTLREALQTLGTDWARNMIGPDIWVQVARSRLAAMLARPDIRGVVCDDVRFPNEAELIRELGGVVVLVSRPGLVQMSHASEGGLPAELIDVRLPPADTPAELKDALCAGWADLP